MAGIQVTTDRDLTVAIVGKLPRAAIRLERLEHPHTYEVVAE
jgi:hypothetical protein